jgi:3-dehydroquinate dehydratase
MGEISKISRIILPFFGSLFTYTYISKPTAEGQLPLSQIKPLFMEFLGKLPTPL